MSTCYSLADFSTRLVPLERRPLTPSLEAKLRLSDGRRRRRPRGRTAANASGGQGQGDEGNREKSQAARHVGRIPS